MLFKAYVMKFGWGCGWICDVIQLLHHYLILSCCTLTPDSDFYIKRYRERDIILTAANLLHVLWVCCVLDVIITAKYSFFPSASFKSCLSTKNLLSMPESLLGSVNRIADQFCWCNVDCFDLREVRTKCESTNDSQAMVFPQTDPQIFLSAECLISNFRWAGLCF